MRRRAGRSAAVCAILWIAVAAAAQQASPVDLGRRAMAAHDYAAAAALFATASTTDGTAESAVLQAEAELLASDAVAAEAAARTALERDVRSAPARYLLARALQQQNQPAASLDAFTAAAALRPPTGEELRLVGLDYVLLNDYADALRWLRKAVEQQPGNAEAWYSMGRVLWTQGNLPEAATALQQALRIDPGMARAANNLGLVYEAQNDSAQALASYRKAVALQQGTAHPSEQPLLNLGRLLIEGAQPAEAMAPLRQAVALAPNDAACHEALARAAAATHQDSEAEQQMELAVALDTTNPRTHYELGRIYRTAGKADKAKDEFAASARLYGTTSKRDR